MKNKSKWSKTLLTVLLCCLMAFSNVSSIVYAEDTTPKTAVETAQELVDALPDATSEEFVITAANYEQISEEYIAASSAIDDLSTEEAAGLSNTDKIDALFEALNNYQQSQGEVEVPVTYETGDEQPDPITIALGDGAVNPALTGDYIGVVFSTNQSDNEPGAQTHKIYLWNDAAHTVPMDDSVIIQQFVDQGDTIYVQYGDTKFPVTMVKETDETGKVTAKYLTFNTAEGQTLAFELKFMRPSGTTKNDTPLYLEGKTGSFTTEEDTKLSWNTKPQWTLTKTSNYGSINVLAASDEGAGNLQLSTNTTVNGSSYIYYSINGAKELDTASGHVNGTAIEFTDTLTLPSGVTLPSGWKKGTPSVQTNWGFDTAGNQVYVYRVMYSILDAKGNTIYQMRTPYVPASVKDKLLALDPLTVSGQTITCKATLNDLTTEEYNLISSIRNIDSSSNQDYNWSAYLYPRYLKVSDDYDSTKQATISNNAAVAAKTIEDTTLTTKATADKNVTINSGTPNVTFSKTGSGSTVAGDVYNFTLNLANTGAATAKGYSIKEQLPQSLYMTEAQQAKLKADVEKLGYTITFSEDVGNSTAKKTKYFIISNMDIAPGAKPVISIPMTILNSTLFNGLFYADNYDENNNSTYNRKDTRDTNYAYLYSDSTQTTEIGRDNSSLYIYPAKITVGKSFAAVDVSTLTADSIITYTVTAKCDKDYSASDVVVSDTLDAGMFLIDDNNVSYKDKTDGTYTANVGGHSAKITISGTSTKIEWTYAGGLTTESKVSLTYKSGFRSAPNMAAGFSYVNTVRTNVNADFEKANVYKPAPHVPTGVFNGLSKKVVTATTPEETLSDYSVINEGDSVTYKLTINNSGDGVLTITGAIDQLPAMLDSIVWDSSNVIMGKGNFGTDYTIDSVAGTIKWNSISIPAETIAYQYVTLKFPSGTNWDNYLTWVETKSVKTINTFKYGTYSASVRHDLPVPNRIYLQKNVTALYATGTTTDSSSQLTINNNDGSLIEYVKPDITSGANITGKSNEVKYEVVLYNGGIKPIAVTSLTDILPEGVTFSRFGTGSYSSNWSYWVTNHGGGSKTTTLPTDTVYKAVSIANTVSGNQIKFSFTPLQYASWSNHNYEIGYEDVCSVVNKIPVLEKGQAIVFSYYCTVDADKTDEISHNTIAYQDDTTLGPVVKADVTITGKGNDGDCNVLTDSQAEKLGYETKENTTWIASGVDIKEKHPTDTIVPGISKTAEYYKEKGTTNWKNLIAGQNIEPNDSVVWHIRIYNDNKYTEMSDYKVIDTLELPITLVTEATGQYNSYAKITGYGTYNSRANIFAGNTLVPITSKEITNKKGVAIATEYTFDFSNPAYSIPAGGYMDFYVTSVNNSDTLKFSTLTNTSTVVPTQEFSTKEVTHGANVSSVNGEEVKGVEDADTVFAFGKYATSSLKAVTEKSNTDNTTTGREVDNVIALESRDVTYTLKVQNDSDNTLKYNLRELTIIETLPQIGDLSVTRGVDDPRLSECTVNFADELNLALNVYTNKNVLQSTLVEGTDYTVQYSNKTVFEETDWKGEGSGWSDTRTASSRSFRIVFGETYITPQTYVNCTFDAKLGEDADPGEIAWNSFGYRYKMGNTPATTATLTAAPAKVGVKIAEQKISATKVWEDEDDKAEKRPESVTAQLYHNGVYVNGADQVLNEENDWSCVWNNLVYGDEYEVKEQTVYYYQAEVSEPDEEGHVIITNTYDAENVPPKDSPYTGVHNMMWLWLGLISISVLGVAIFLVIRKKYEINHNQ